jgi:hypothetical protein
MRPSDPDLDLLLLRERADLLCRDCPSGAVAEARRPVPRRRARRFVLAVVRLARAVPRALRPASD